MVYTSRYSNPELRTGKYTAVRISLGTPRWNIGYNLDAEMPDLMPFGLLHKFELYEDEGMGKDVVLLCYEDIRKGPNDWCHRRTFADWWQQRTGEVIPELFDPTPDPTKPCQAPSKRSLETPPTTSPIEQLALF